MRHEWGHNIQMMIMGAGNYLLTVGIMSPLKLREDKWNNYYSSPWETGADILEGEQSRVHTSDKVSKAIWYMVVGSLCPPAAYLFLL